MSCALCGSDHHNVSHCPWRKNMAALLVFSFVGAIYVLAGMLRRWALKEM